MQTAKSNPIAALVNALYDLQEAMMISDELVKADLITRVKGCISLYLQPANEAWGKVIFSQVSVYPPEEGFLYDVTSCLGAWSYVLSWGASFPGPLFLPGGPEHSPPRKKRALCILLKSFLVQNTIQFVQTFSQVE